MDGEITGYSFWNPNTAMWEDTPPTVAPGQNIGIRISGRNAGEDLTRMWIAFTVTRPDGTQWEAQSPEALVPGGQEAIWDYLWLADQLGDYLVDLKLYGEMYAEEELAGVIANYTWT